MMNKRLIIGTVQFGLDYGVANKAGRIGADLGRSILDFAIQNKIDTLDTAIAYGKSEETLGLIGAKEFKIITKLPEVPDMTGDVTGWVESQILSSLKRLKINQLDGILLHRPDQLLDEGGEKLFLALTRQKESGLVKRIGLSIYSTNQLEKLLQNMSFDIVQAPLNIFDQRLISSGWAKNLKKLGVEIHVRSIFLQGLLLMRPEDRPEYFNSWRHRLRMWDEWLFLNKKTPLEICLNYVMSMPYVDRIVVGVDGLNHLREIIDASKCGLMEFPDHLQIQDERLINPSYWNLR